MEGSDFTAYLRAIWRKRGVVVVVLLSTFIGTTMLTRRLPRVYEARVTLFPPLRAGQEIFLLGPMSVPGSFVPIVSPEIAKGYLGIMESWTVAEGAAALVEGRTADHIARNSSFNVTSRNLMEITVRDRNREKAAEIANALAESYNEVFARFRREANRQLLQFITEQLEMAKKDVEVAEEALLQFEREQGIIDMDEESSRLVADLSQIRAERNDTEIRIAEIESNLRRLSLRGSDSLLIDISEQIAVDDPTVQHLRDRVAGIQIELARLLTTFTEAHPRVIAERAELEEAANALREQTLVYLEGELNSLRALLLSQERTLRRIEEELGKLPEMNSDIGQMTREINRRQRIFDRLYSELEELVLQESRELENFVIVDPAVPPSRPAFPVLWMNLLVALAFGSVGAVFLALFLDYLESRRGMHII